MKFKQSLIVLIVLYSFFSGQFTIAQTTTVATNNNKGCGTVKGSFLGDWFDYYERGLSYADCEMWVPAQSDLERAISLRDIDKRRVYTLGMHFITNYFPNRELGIVLYKQQKYSEAERYLLRSLSQFPSTKAEVYLNKTRVMMPTYQSLEKAKPTIEVIPLSAWSNKNGRTLTIEVKDDTFIDKIWVDGHEWIWQDTIVVDKTPISIQSAKPQIKAIVTTSSFSSEIKIEAQDIFGNKSLKVLVNQIDMKPPELIISNIEVNSFDELIVSGYVQDTESGLKSLILNNQVINLIDNNKFAFELVTPNPILNLESEDKAGNKMQLSKKLSTTSPFNMKIEQGSLSTQQDTWLFSAWIQSDSELSRLEINGQTIALHGRQRQVTKTIPLIYGINSIHVEALDFNGEKIEQNLEVVRTLPFYLDLQHRLRLALFPFSCDLNTGLSCANSDLLYSELDINLRNINRFRLVERATLSEQLDSMKLCELMVTEECAWKVAQLIKTQTMLIGEMLTRTTLQESSEEVYVRVVDASTGAVLTAFDAFRETLDDETIKEQLMLKLQQRFPLTSSTSVEVKNRKIQVGFARDASVWRNMPVNLFSNEQSCGVGIIKKIEDNQLAILDWQGKCNAKQIDQVTTM